MYVNYTKNDSFAQTNVSAQRKSHPFTKPSSNVFRRKQPSLTPDQPLPQPDDQILPAKFAALASGVQHAFWYQQAAPLDNNSQSQFKNKAGAAKPNQAASYPISRKDLVVEDEDSDSFDFNEIDNEIKDTLHQSSLTNEDDASEQFTDATRPRKSSIQDSDKSFKSAENHGGLKSLSAAGNSTAELTVTSINSQQQMKAEISAATSQESNIIIEDDCCDDSASGASSSESSCPAVIVPSEAVLFFDNLDNYLAQFGPVLSVNDINESIQVQYQDRDSALKLQAALSDQQIDAKLASSYDDAKFKQSSSCSNQQLDAQLTLKLLKISPKVNNLAIKKSDSEFLKDFNTTSMHSYYSSSQLIVSTEDDSEADNDNLSMEAPSLEQAYQMMTSDKFSSEIGFMFAPKLSFTQPVGGYLQHQQASASYVAPPQQPRSSSFKLLDQQHKNFTNNQTAAVGGSGNNPFSNQSQSFFQPSMNMSMPNRYSNGSNPFSQQTSSSGSFFPRTTSQPNNSNNANKPQFTQGCGGASTYPEFKVNLERLLNGEDRRTTIMIRHIPNKYTEEMLLKRIDRLHKGRYDFFYLPLDLNNGCNIGYAFINFVDPVYIVPFFEDLNNQSWESFNSEKICQITFGRIQGKRNLLENVSKQSDARKVQPLVLEIQHERSQVECFRASLMAAQHQRRFSMPLKKHQQQFHH